MNSEKILQRLGSQLSPSIAQRDAIRLRLRARIDAPALLAQTRTALTPDVSVKTRVWARILSSIEPQGVISLLSRLRSFLAPLPEQRWTAWQMILSRLGSPVLAFQYAPLKWASALLIVIVVLRASPVLFLAPQSTARSSVLFLPTHGRPEVSIGTLWQPINAEFSLKQAADLRTQQGDEATIVLHDDGNIRLKESTTITLHDLTDRPEPALEGATITLHGGTLWVQGFIPNHLRNLIVAFPGSEVLIREGSVSIAVEGNLPIVRVWDRHVVVSSGGRELMLIAGEQAEIGADASLVATKIDEEEYTTSWNMQNLGRDAVHRKEIAQWQHERLAAAAGILPNSPLYPVKRAVEKFDELFTFDPEARVQKKLTQASVRLKEASALIAQGQSGATVLAEYRSTIMEIASGSGGGSVTQFLVRQEIAENAAEVAAALPNDDLYLVKQTVLAAGTDLPEPIVDEKDIRGSLLLDTLSVVQESLEAGDLSGASETFEALSPYLDSLKEEHLMRPEVRKEALSLLHTVVSSLEGQGSGSGQVVQEILEMLPRPVSALRPEPLLSSLSDEQIDAGVRRVLHDVFETYSMPKSRQNELKTQMHRYSGHPDEGKFLRRLLEELPENTELRTIVRRAIQNVREQRLEEGM